MTRDFILVEKIRTNKETPTEGVFKTERGHSSCLN